MKFEQNGRTCGQNTLISYVNVCVCTYVRMCVCMYVCICDQKVKSSRSKSWQALRHNQCLLSCNHATV